jgi:hypothetical protein
MKMNFLFARRVSIPADVLIQELAGEAVLLNLKTEQYFGLDPVGVRMWQLLVAEPSIQTAYERLLDEYDAEPEQLQRDLTELIEQLVAHGLVDIAPN